MAYSNITGFSVDSPNVLVKTANGDFSTVVASSADITFSGDTIQIQGGQSYYQIAEIDKSKKIDIKITDAEYNMQGMALATGGTISTGADTYDVYGVPYTADATGLIVLPYVVVPSSLRVNGYTETTGTVTSGLFKVTINASTTNVQFTATESGMVFTPAFSVAVASATSLIGKTNDFPKTGEVRFTYPLYSDPNSPDSKIIGNMQITIYKAKIVQSYKLGGGMKTAQTFDLQLSGLDAGRADKQMWKATFIPLTTDTTPPTISTIVPANNATAVVVSAPIVVTFSEPINPALVNSSNFIVMKSTDGSQVSGTFAFNATNNILTFTPGASFSSATKYFVTITSDVTDVAGNRLTANSVTSFTTA